MKKKQKKTPLYVPILWFITTGLWVITFSMSISYERPMGLIFLQGLTVLTSLIAAIANLYRYNKTKDIEDDT